MAKVSDSYDDAEEVGALPGPAPIERVIDSESGKTYSIKAMVADFNSPFFDYDSAIIEIEPPTPILSEDARIIGYASLQIEGNKLVAVGSVDYHSPERLTLETKSQDMWLHLVGNIHYQDPGNFEVTLNLMGAKMKVEIVSINYLILASWKPHDKRIPPVGTPIL